VIDKAKVIQQSSTEVDTLVEKVFPSEFDAHGANGLLGSIMNVKLLAVYELALRCETEMYTCERAGAYLAGCLMGAAMNEACLSLLCLSYREEVMTTHHYRNAKLRESYEVMVGHWKFEHLIRVAKELTWIPNTVVDAPTIAALLDAYRELMPASYPTMLRAEIEMGAAEFETAPGIAMLKLIQELRNSIHSGSWIRGKRRLDDTHFDGWCRIAIRVSAETRNCLLHFMAERSAAMVRSQVAVFDEQMASAKEVLLRSGKTALEADAILADLISQSLSDAQR
jgi:hypothetical protein